MYNKNMNNYCNQCGICCKLIPSYNNNIIRDGIQPVEEFFTPVNIETAININETYVQKVHELFPEAQFYTCKYLSKDNRCTNPNMPENCKNFPSSPVSIIPENCGYFGEIFLKHEALKQKVRKLKEEIIYYEAQISSDSKEKNNYQKIINSRQNYIKKFEQFGSSNW